MNSFKNLFSFKSIQSLAFSFAYIQLYFFDAINKFLRLDGNIDFLLYPRLCFYGICILIIGSYIFVRRVSLYFICAVFVTILLYVIGVLNSNSYEVSFTESSIQFLRYICFYCVIGAVLTLKDYHLPFKVILNIFLFNSIIIIFGFLFGIEQFRTYGHIFNDEEGWRDERFGFDGFILEQNNATYFTILGLYTLQVNNKFRIKIGSLFAWVSAFLVGTKALFISTFLIFFLSSRFAIKTLCNSIVIISSILLISCLLLLIDLDYYFYNDLLSGRLESLVSKYQSLKFNNLIGWDRFLFGFYDGDYNRILTELGTIDLFVFFGILGTSVYFSVLYFCYRTYCFDQKAKFVFFVFLITDFFTGHLFYDPAGVVYLGLLFLVFRYQQDREFHTLA